MKPGILVFSGLFKIQAFISSGGFGKVYAGKASFKTIGVEINTQKKVAIKFVILFVY